MGNDIPLGRIAGIKVGMNVTVFLVAGFYAFGLAAYILPGKIGDQGETAYWVCGVLGAVFLLLSLLVHELGHALVATEEGIEVEGMSLTVTGGITRMRSAPTTPGSEFRISVVGPVGSAICGVIFLVVAYLTPDQGLTGLVGATFAWVGGANLFLAGFNMIPAAPLDGGRVLSAGIWQATGSQSTAMAIASVCGVAGGMVGVVFGVRSLGNPRWGNFAFLIIAMAAFVLLNAIQQLVRLPMYRALDGMTAADAMASEPPTAPGWATVADFLRSSTPRPEHQAYPVVGPDGQVSGLLTAAAIRAVPPQRWERLQVGELAYPIDRITLIHLDEPLLPALQKVETGSVAHALVVAPDGRIVGTLDPSAIDRMMARRKERLKALRA